MKRAFIFFLPFMVMLGAGCMKHNDSDGNTFPVPSGSFAGKFTRLHYNTTKKGYDTLSANIVLTMDVKTGYKVTGDTSTVHAGSFGDFSMNAYAIQFADKTYTSTPPPSKIHLYGIYEYGYDGTNLQIDATFADTLGFFYDLKRQ
ncbi:hypothetical protein HQ865_05030 [Mucilaginibacter mali]|uniref:Lipoprotein n=1 Tax=Mucilaginibacter mali TaxID=2740462 RepID=A0A7D4Q8W4_9SPHI|nr:hypothetical protein [Mucilaginibacter mali]QKJ29144.1 hypothetical protein HQ865_05030 [Mucilaginibacter mali]